MAKPAAQTKARVARRSDERLTGLFLDMLAAERGAQGNTLSAYRRDLLDFSAHRTAGGGSAKTASRKDILSYLGMLSRSGVTGSTQARRLSALRQFFAFLYSEGVREDNPTDAVESPRRQRPLGRGAQTRTARYGQARAHAAGRN